MGAGVGRMVYRNFGMRREFLSQSVFVYATSIFLSAFLMFLLQPMVAKMILPYLGGATSVWTVCMLFFQGVLFAGYLYAHGSIKYLGVKKQSMLHIVLLLISFFWLPLSLKEVTVVQGVHESLFVLLTLSSTIFLPFFVLSANAPMLQKWFAHTQHKSAANPYFLYAVSNMGSFIALIGYPFVFEPTFDLADQTFYWAMVYGVFALFISLTAIALVKNFKAVKEHVSSETLISWRRKLYWCALSFVPSSLLVGSTTYITTDIASVPLLWVIPLALYLFSFILAFSNRVKLPFKLLSFVITMCVAFVCLKAIFLSYTFLHIFVPLVLLFSVSCLFHRRLAVDAPESSHLTEYYLWMSFGGMLGGLFNSLVAPIVFTQVTEFKLVAVLALLGCISKSVKGDVDRKAATYISFWFALVLACFFIAKMELLGENSAMIYKLYLPIVFLAFFVFTYDLKIKKGFVFFLAVFFLVEDSSLSENEEYKVRSFYGTYLVHNADGIRTISHGTTLHGAQHIEGPDRLKPIYYYSHQSGLGRAIQALNKSYFNEGSNVAVLGLGAGAISCLFDKGQNITYYEIDPIVAELATNDKYFTFLKECTPKFDIQLGDARVRIKEASSDQYKMIILDAFSSDSIPVHLLTKEAIGLYLEKLEKGGLLMVHISNRHLDLRQVLAAISHEFDLSGVVYSYMVDDPQSTEISSQWVALSKDHELIKESFVDWEKLDTNHNASQLWTDGYSSILHILK